MSTEEEQAPGALQKKSIALGRAGLELTTLAEWWRFAEMTARSALCPGAYQNKPEDVLLAFQMGAEVGFHPMQALQMIAVIGKRPAVFGDGIPALIMRSGKCAAYTDGYRGKKDSDTFTAWASSTRADNGITLERTFSVADAKEARLWNEKEGPWKLYKTRQLLMRARAFLARDLYADVLHGLSVVEEVRDYIDTTSEPAAEPTSIEDPPARVPEEDVSQEPPAVLADTPEIPPETYEVTLTRKVEFDTTRGHEWGFQDKRGRWFRTEAPPLAAELARCLNTVKPIVVWAVAEGQGSFRVRSIEA